MKKLMTLIRNEEGATALEYGLLAALIAAVIAAAVGVVGTQANSAFQSVGSAMSGGA